MPLVYPSRGRCIYCGVTGVRLTKEHIIPRSLFGTAVILEASCDNCSKITSAIEDQVARGIFGMYRGRNSFPTYKAKRKKPKVAKVTFVRGGEVQQQDVQGSEYPHIYVAPELTPPGLIERRPLSELNPEFKLKLVADEKTIESLLARSGAESVKLPNTFNWAPFFKMLAKIAHCYAVAQQPVPFDPFLPDLILGRSPYLGHYVGGVYDASFPTGHPGELTALVDERTGIALLIIIVRLPGFASMPPYCVVAGQVLPL